MKTVLITGASGRIGKPLCMLLSKKGYSVRAFVRKKGSIIGRNITEFEGDVLDFPSIARAAEGVDAIVHLAALIDSGAPSEKLFSINVLGTKNALAAAPDGCRFIYASSIAIYGRNLPPVADENSPALPSTLYGKSKYLAEACVLCEQGRLDVVSLQFGVIYGSGFSEGYHSVFRMLQKGKMKIIGEGKNYLPFVHADDVLRALVLALEKPAPSCIYLIVGEQKTQKELLCMAAKSLGVPAPSMHISKGTAMFFAKLHDFACRLQGKKPALNYDSIEMISSHRAFDTRRAQEELGWKAKVKLKDGVSQMAKDYLKMQPKKG